MTRIAIVAVLGLTACDSTAEDKAAADAKAKAAAENKAEDEAAAKRKAQREAEAAKAEQQAAALEAELDALAVIPETLPKSLDKACEQMLEAYDGYMQKVLTGDMLTKWKTGGNEMQIAVFRKECLERDIATAACQAQALTNAAPELEKQLPDIMKACAEKAAAAAGG